MFALAPGEDIFEAVDRVPKSICARSLAALEKTRGLRDDAIEESVRRTLIGGDKTFTGR